ncbi:hypothetical protein LL033_25620 (plasmid) [Clostridium estertheticum]|uniref:hypothetical protein n=1 Tax=Clostridium estertheticum TaxID=238834 RepID=UPI001C0D5251|nr:hypothetical protein [Clostridium estertheticum]MBU3217365.1 hypothetical protein [Clostridium estertheticum]WAG58139.1 hypothetical protein LL033_25620 [Clostridium estertheticum]
MPLTTEAKLKNLVIEIQALCTIYVNKALKDAKKTRLIFNIQIILTTMTTILLGLKLGEIGQSVAFILSALATGLTSLYNIENHRKQHSQCYTYTFKLVNLSTQVNFYRTNFDPLEESKFIEYSETYFELMKEFQELTSVFLESKNIKKEAKL